MPALKRVVMVLVIACAALGGGCQSAMRLPSSTPGQTFVRDASLAKIVRSHARQGNKLRDLDTTLDVWAVYEGWEYRMAMLNTRAEQYAWSAAKKAEHEAKHRSEFDQNVSFVVAIYTSDKDWIELGRDNAVWQPFLVAGASDLIPASSIEETEIPAEELRVAFPFLTRWQKLYKVTFPRSHDGMTVNPGSDPVALEFRSLLGIERLTWQFEDSTPQVAANTNELNFRRLR